MSDSIFQDRRNIVESKRIVIKVGTSTITYENGRMNLRNIERLSRAISSLMNQGKEVILVTSGAIGVGIGCLDMKEKPTAMRDKQAVAAVGQCELMNVYSRCFAEYSHVVAQILLTKDDLDDPVTRENISNTFDALIEKGIVPIINENTVSFSLTIGTMPFSIRASNVLEIFSRVTGSSRSSLVRRICATTWLYSAKHRLYTFISSHCPTAATACLSRMSVGFSFMSRHPIPTPIAPDVTRITSLPWFIRLDMARASLSMLRRFIPVSYTHLTLPTNREV